MAMSTPNSAVLVDWFERLALLLAWAFVIIVFGAVRPNTFLTWGNFSAILGSQAVLVVVALGLTLSLTAGDYDLSIASVLSLAGTVLAVLNARNGVPIGWAIVAALAVGAAVGFINGFFVIFFRINSMIVTLGIGTFVHGVTLWLGDQETISGISSDLVEAVIVRRLFGVPLSFYYAFALCVLIWYVFSYTVLGRRLLFVGRGREIARLSGIRVDRLRWGCFIVSGLMGAIAGILYVGTVAAADPNSGLSFLLPAFAAAFLGATSINPGRFNPWGDDDQRVFPGHRHHRAFDSRRQHLHPGPVLWWCAGGVGDAVADRPRARGAADVGLRRSA